MTLESKLPLKLNLQHFADEGTKDTDPEPKPNPEPKDESGNAEDVNSEGEGGDKEGGQSDDEKRFTQAELEDILKDRLAREKKAREDDKKKAEDEAERKRLEEQGEYKTLLDGAREELANKEAEIAEKNRRDSINAKLEAKGLGPEDVTRYTKYVEKLVGSDDEDEQIDGAVNEVYNDFVATKQSQSGDPSAGFGDSKKPEQQGADEFGRSLYQGLKK